MINMKRPVVDGEICIGCGMCESICPGVFRVGDDMKSRVENPGACETCDCQEAVDSCPVSAISWEQ